jgi:hypothetical protein
MQSGSERNAGLFFNSSRAGKEKPRHHGRGWIASNAQSTKLAAREPKDADRQPD